MNSRLRLPLGFMTLQLASCSAVSNLPNVVIVGGSGEQREAVREEAAAFHAAVAPIVVQLVRVEFAPRDEFDGTDGTASGVYNTGKIIWLDETMPIAQVPDVFRHELCHAIDFQFLDVPRRLAVELEPLATMISGSPDDVAGFAKGEEKYDDLLLREVFARLCEAGPVAAHLYANHCGDGDLTLRQAYTAFQGELWTGTYGLEDGAPSDHPVVGFPPDVVADAVGPFQDVRAVGRQGDDGPLVDARVQGEQYTGAAFFHALTGDVAFGSVPGSAEVVGDDLRAPLRAAPGVVIHDRVGWSDGPYGGVATVDIKNFEPVQRPVVFSGDGRWVSPGPPCLGEDPFFLEQDGLYRIDVVNDNSVGWELLLVR